MYPRLFSSAPPSPADSRRGSNKREHASALHDKARDVQSVASERGAGQSREEFLRNLSFRFERADSATNATELIKALANMNHFDVLRSLVPLLAGEMGDASAVSLYASAQALQRWQSRHRRDKVLPGTPAMRNNALEYGLITQAYRMCRLATASYGWKGAWHTALRAQHARARAYACAPYSFASPDRQRCVHMCPLIIGTDK
ncbi:hypothetical protein EON66_03550 [archaeon]|nr:MAG: hypothetical protein EON66_03550 [archaeon]